MLRALAVLTFSVGILAVSAVCDEIPQTVVDVRIEGNETIPEAHILQKIQIQPGRSVSSRQIREDKRTLMTTRWFYNVNERFERTPQGTVLIFSVRERPIVRRVEFIGNKKVKTKQLVAWTGLKVGSPYDYIANREAVHRLEQEYKDKGFYFVRVSLQQGNEPGGREVVFNIEEGPKVRVREREFVGVGDLVSSGRLATKLESKKAIMGLFGGLYRPETLKQDEAALKQYYVELGHFDVDVKAEPLFHPRDKGHVKIRYTIQEGVRYRVRDIRYEGQNVLSVAQLTEEREMQEGQFFNALPLSKDVRFMLGLYGDRGHYAASVRPQYHFTEQPGIVDIVFEIDEDRVRYIRDFNVQFASDHPHTKQTVILDRLQIEPGDLANPRLIQRGQSRVNGGGLFEGVMVNVVPVDPETEQIMSGSRTFRGQQPQRYGHQADWTDRFIQHVGRTSSAKIPYGHASPAAESSAPVRQNVNAQPPAAEDTPNVTRIPSSNTPSVLSYVQADPARLFYGQPEDLLVSHLTEADTKSDDIVIRAQSPNGSYYAPPAGPTPRPGDPILQGSPYNNQFQTLPPGWVDINVQATEGRTGRLMFGAGVNSDAGIVGSFIWDESNFDLFNPPRTFADIIEGRAWRGGGQRFRFEAAPGDVVSRYALQWTDPYFLYSDYSLSLSGFYFNRFYPDWDEDRMGGRIAVGRQLSPEWSVSGALRLEEVEVKNVGSVPAAPQELVDTAGTHFLSTFRASATHDTRNASILPSEGHYMDLAYEQAFGDFNYPRLEAEFRQYFTTHQRPDGSGRQVLTLAGNVGWSGDDTPIFERYYAGGFQSFRGFAYRGVTPRAGTSNVGVGGNWQVLGTAEYRVPLTADDMINAVAFADVGTVEEDVSLSNIRATVGVGLRIVVPAMGPVPLAFDFGFPVSSDRLDDERIFSFYVGINR
jgi:outer membrane protein insertion porin family